MIALHVVALSKTIMRLHERAALIRFMISRIYLCRVHELAGNMKHIVMTDREN